MRQQVSNALLALYERATRAGMLDRPLQRRVFESAYIVYKRFIEAGPFGALRGLVPEGSTVVDVGANIGFFSVPFARWVGPAGRVIAVEPEARNLASLNRRVSQAGVSAIVDRIDAAATDRVGQVRLALTPGHPGDHHLADEGELVQAVTVDALVGEDSRRVVLIKIDVQGAESLVLAGARTVIRAHRPAIYVEVDGAGLARMGSSPRDLIRTIVELGYLPYRLTRRGIGGQDDVDRLVTRSSVGYIDVLFLAV